jgi:hypothetical protein
MTILLLESHRIQERRRARRRFSVPAVMNDMKSRLQKTGHSALNAKDGGTGSVQILE